MPLFIWRFFSWPSTVLSDWMHAAFVIGGGCVQWRCRELLENSFEQWTMYELVWSRWTFVCVANVHEWRELNFTHFNIGCAAVWALPKMRISLVWAIYSHKSHPYGREAIRTTRIGRIRIPTKQHAFSSVHFSPGLFFHTEFIFAAFCLNEPRRCACMRPNYLMVCVLRYICVYIHTYVLGNTPISPSRRTYVYACVMSSRTSSGLVWTQHSTQHTIPFQSSKNRCIFGDRRRLIRSIRQWAHRWSPSKCFSALDPCNFGIRIGHLAVRSDFHNW